MRLLRWWVQRSLAKAGSSQRGRLYYLDERGDLHELGPAPDAAGLAWAVGLAYRATRDRHDRAALAAVRQQAATFSEQMKRATAGVDQPMR